MGRRKNKNNSPKNALVELLAGFTNNQDIPEDLEALVIQAESSRAWAARKSESTTTSGEEDGREINWDLIEATTNAALRLGAADFALAEEEARQAPLLQLLKGFKANPTRKGLAAAQVAQAKLQELAPRMSLAKEAISRLEAELEKLGSNREEMARHIARGFADARLVVRQLAATETTAETWARKYRAPETSEEAREAHRQFIADRLEAAKKARAKQRLRG